MQLQAHLITTLPVFGLEDSIADIIEFFSTTTYSHVAVANEEGLLGLLAEDDLEAYKECKVVADYQYSMEAFFVKRETSWFDVMEEFSRNEANLLPVLDGQRKVLGYYDLSDVVSMFIDTPFFTEPGSIVVLAKGVKDYSFSEISQIVEGNNTRLLGGFVSEFRNDVVHITLKLGADNYNEVLQTFRRYGYSIEFGNDDDKFIESLKERSNYLSKYLNV
ncbi:CBS domain-containing protein [Sediminicola luteus]|uniref:Acetoin utilization protein acuB n=1 Tax=Sediminicola luteus TaxID=319238 RepID=A0A2A4G6I3_9FLAO|nr:CBS domain-containing protein [Sediminicola luteus]PCE63598.1 acetoin utilization protein acuB [Sediminicola luteus]